MTKTIELIFDLGSPNAYLAIKVIPEIANRVGAAVKLVPCLLGGIFKATGNRSPMEAFSGVSGKLAYDLLEMRRFVLKHQLTQFQFNPHFPVNTLLAMRGMVAAQHIGIEHTYLEAMLKALWEDGRKLDEPGVFLAVLNEAGLNGDQILTLTQDPAIKAELIANTEHAVERGTFGVPTFFVGSEMFFGKERLGQIEELLCMVQS